MEEVNLMFPEKDNLDVQDELKAIIEKYLQTKDVISLWGRMGPNDNSQKIALMGVYSDSNRDSVGSLMYFLPCGTWIEVYLLI